MRETNKIIASKFTQHPNTLGLMEYAAIASTGVGVIASLIYKSSIYVALPFSASLFLNLISRKQYESLLKSYIIERSNNAIAEVLDSTERLNLQDDHQNNKHLLSPETKEYLESLISSQTININQEITNLAIIGKEVNHIQTEIIQIKSSQQELLNAFNQHEFKTRDQALYIEEQTSVLIKILESHFSELESKIKTEIALPKTNLSSDTQDQEIMNKRRKISQPLINRPKDSDFVVSEKCPSPNPKSKQEHLTAENCLGYISTSFRDIEGIIEPLRAISRNMASNHLSLCVEFLSKIQLIIEEWLEKNPNSNFPPSSQENFPSPSTLYPEKIGHDSNWEQEFSDQSPRGTGSSLQNGN